MSGFDQRKTAEEARFALDAELAFKAKARRNKLLGLWAADLLGVTGDAADAYAKEVVRADFEEPGDDDVFRKIRADFDAKGVSVTDHQIQRHMDEMMEEAARQIRSEAGR